MFGHDWEKVTGKVVERRDADHQWNKGQEQISPSYKYVVEATLPDGSTRSEELSDYIGTRQFSLTKGRQVALLYDKHGALKWDEDDPDLKAARGIVDLDEFRNADGKVMDSEELIDLAKRTPAPGPTGGDESGGAD
jgi:hypothetical protein